MISDKLKYDRIFGKVFNKNNMHVANLVIVENNKPFADCDSVVFEAVCKLITKEVSGSDDYQTYGKIYQEKLIKNLLDGDYDDRELYASHVADMYDDALKANLYLAVADISQCDPDFTKLVYFRDLFSQIQPAYKYAIYSNYILIIISTDNRVINVNKELKEINNLLEQNDMYVGISGRFENLFELRKYYMEALKALKYISGSKSSQRIFPYDINSVDTMEQIKALKNGVGVQYLLNEAFRILGNPVLLHDMGLKLLGYTENVKVNDPIWEEYVTYGTVNDETIDFFQNEGFVDALVNTKACTFLTSDKLKYDRISGKIYNKDNIMVGCLAIVASHRSFDDDAIALFGAFCGALSKEVSRNEFYNRYGQAYSETLISKLIDGNINDCTLFSEGLASIYDDLKGNLYLAVIDIAQCDPERVKPEYFRDLFKQLQTAYRYAVYANYILIIISSDNTSFNADKELNEIRKLFKQNNIYAGISSCFDNIYELGKRYTEAVNALNNGLKNQ